MGPVSRIVDGPNNLSWTEDWTGSGWVRGTTSVRDVMRGSKLSPKELAELGIPPDEYPSDDVPSDDVPPDELPPDTSPMPSESLPHISEQAQLLAALQFAAHKHRAQRRKDVDASPYINHPIEVATILATRGGITDPPTPHSSSPARYDRRHRDFPRRTRGPIRTGSARAGA